MDDFAKLFNDPEYGQILVVIQDGNEGPEIRFSARMDEFDLGVCSFAVEYDKNDSKTWALAEQKFKEIDLEKAQQAINPIRDQLRAAS